MPNDVSFQDLANKIAEMLLIPPPKRPGSRYNLTFDTANNLEVSTSFAGLYSSPYAGQVRLDPAAPETLSLAHDFLNFLAQESGLTLPDLADDDPVLQPIVELVSSDEAGDAFFKVFTGQVEEGRFDLRGALDRLQVEKLPNVQTWELAEIEQRGQLAQLLHKLATDDVLRYAAEVKLREYKWRYVIHDHRHYLLFGQNRERITPKAWFDAAWEFIQHFRCNFGMFVTEAMLYDKVTIIGAENASVPVGRRDQEFLEEYTGYLEREDGTKEPWRQVERLNVVNAKQLSKLLKDRIKRGVCFEGGEIHP